MAKTALIYSLLFATGISPLFASEHEHEQHEAHVHGEAQLLIAQEGNQLEIEFKSPAINIVGFEHKPSNAKQEASLEAAVATLKQPGQLFPDPLRVRAQVAPDALRRLDDETLCLIFVEG